MRAENARVDSMLSPPQRDLVERFGILLASAVVSNIHIFPSHSARITVKEAEI